HAPISTDLASGRPLRPAGWALRPPDLVGILRPRGRSCNRSSAAPRAGNRPSRPASLYRPAGPSPGGPAPGARPRGRGPGARAPPPPLASWPSLPGPGRPLLARDEHVLARELLEQGRRLAEVGGQHIDRVGGHPFGQANFLVDAGVEADEDAARLVADVLQRVA